MGIMAEVLESAHSAAAEAGAYKANSITLEIGEMTEVVPDALEFAFEALSPGTILEGATLEIRMISPKSHCSECDTTYEHDRFQMVCPNCGSMVVEMLQGRELHIKSMDVDISEDVAAEG